MDSSPHIRKALPTARQGGQDSPHARRRFARGVGESETNGAWSGGGFVGHVYLQTAFAQNLRLILARLGDLIVAEPLANRWLFDAKRIRDCVLRWPNGEEVCRFHADNIDMAIFFVNRRVYSESK